MCYYFLVLFVEKNQQILSYEYAINFITWQWRCKTTDVTKHTKCNNIPGSNKLWESQHLVAVLTSVNSYNFIWCVTVLMKGYRIIIFLNYYYYQFKCYFYLIAWCQNADFVTMWLNCSLLLLRYSWILVRNSELKIYSYRYAGTKSYKLLLFTPQTYTYYYMYILCIRIFNYTTVFYFQVRILKQKIIKCVYIISGEWLEFHENHRFQIFLF